MKQNNLTSFFKPKESPTKKATPKKRTLDEMLSSDLKEDSTAIDQQIIKSSQKITKKDTKTEELKKEEQKTSEVQKSTEITKEFNPKDDPLESFDTFIDAIGDWKEPLKMQVNGTGFKMLYSFVKKEYKNETCFPPPNQIFSIYRYSSIQDVKVVILGQDPYIKQGEAMGMCFSINEGVKVPPSLKQVYKALNNDSDVEFATPNPIHGDLTRWASQGVFLLNTILTVKAGKSNSHKKKGWEDFTKETLRQINKNRENVVYLLWGKQAHEQAVLVNKAKNLVIQEQHPSPLAGQGFVNTKCFSKCNQYLIDNGRKPIDWNL